MPLNVATFRKRSLTALIFVIIMLLGILWNEWSFFALFTLVHVGCWIEYQQLVAKIDPAYKNISSAHRYGIIMAGWCMMWFFAVPAFSRTGEWRQYLVIGCLLLLLLCVVADVWQATFTARNLALSLGGLLYISMCWSLMIDLRMKGIMYLGDQQFDIGWVIPLVLIASIWINDTMAYIVGSFIGRSSLSSISPNKTWEGTTGGALLAVFTVTLCWYWFVTPVSWKEVMGIAIIGAVVGTCGDLLESKLKRLAKVKDSGQLMPGHGGFLDRFDSLLLATPFVWLYMELLDLVF